MSAAYRFKNTAPGTTELFLYDEIGGFGINPQQFIADLNAVPNGNRIHVRINSPGGSVSDGVAIFSELRRRGNVSTSVDGLAASMASVIALAGKPVQMADGAMFMIHNASVMADGDAAQLRKAAETLDKFNDTIISAYVGKTGMSREKVCEMMDAETWFTAQEALDAGFVDEITEPLAIAAHAKPEWLAKFRKPPVLTPPAASMQEPTASAPTPEPEIPAATEPATTEPETTPAPTPDEAAAVAAAVTAQANELTEVRARATSLESQVTALAAERDGFKAQLDAEKAERTRLSTLYTQLKASLGLNPAASMPVIKHGAMGADDIATQLDAIKDPFERATFIAKNREAIRAAKLSVR